MSEYKTEPLVSYRDTLAAVAKQAAPSNSIVRALLRIICKRLLDPATSPEHAGEIINDLKLDHLHVIWKEAHAEIVKEPLKYDCQPEDVKAPIPPCNDERIALVKKVMFSVAESRGFWWYLTTKSQASVSLAQVIAEQKALREGMDKLTGMLGALQISFDQTKQVNETRAAAEKALAEQKAREEQDKKKQDDKKQPPTYSIERISGEQQRCWLRVIARLSNKLTRNFSTLDHEAKKKEEDAAMAQLVVEGKKLLPLLKDEDLIEYKRTSKQVIEVLDGTREMEYTDMLLIARVICNVDIILIPRYKKRMPFPASPIFLADPSSKFDIGCVIWTYDDEPKNCHFDIVVRSAPSNPVWRFTAAELESIKVEGQKLVLKLEPAMTPLEQPPLAPLAPSSVPLVAPSAVVSSSPPLVIPSPPALNSNTGVSGNPSTGPPATAVLSGQYMLVNGTLYPVSSSPVNKGKGKNKNQTDKRKQENKEGNTGDKDDKKKWGKEGPIVLRVAAEANLPQSSNVIQMLTGAGVPRSLIGKVEAAHDSNGWVVRSLQPGVLRNKVKEIASQIPFVSPWVSPGYRGKPRQQEQRHSQNGAKMEALVKSVLQQNHLMQQNQTEMRSFMQGVSEQLAWGQQQRFFPIHSPPLHSPQSTRTPSPVHLPPMQQQDSPPDRGLYLRQPQPLQMHFVQSPTAFQQAVCPFISRGQPCGHLPQCRF